MGTFHPAKVEEKKITWQRGREVGCEAARVHEGASAIGHQPLCPCNLLAEGYVKFENGVEMHWSGRYSQFLFLCASFAAVRQEYLHIPHAKNKNKKTCKKKKKGGERREEGRVGGNSKAEIVRQHFERQEPFLAQAVPETSGCPIPSSGQATHTQTLRCG